MDFSNLIRASRYGILLSWKSGIFKVWKRRKKKMSNITMVEAELPPGFRFHPRDEELICDYLMKKVTCSDSTLLIEVDLNKSEPWEIPETACVGGKEWYFYSQRDRKYAIGLRTNRATASGYWKATGKDRPVLRKGTLVGMRKTLVFYQGRAPKGLKTDWVMHEFRIEGQLPHKVSSLKEDWVLCRVLYKKRELLPSKANMGSYYYDDITTSSSLPPLMDSYLTFDQITHTTPQEQNYTANNNQVYQQVPCFSNNFSQTPTFIMDQTLISTTLKEGGPYLNAPFAYDKDVLKIVLSHLAKIETSKHDMKGSLSLGETSSESYLYI